jgi:hypothetical protein
VHRLPRGVPPVKTGRSRWRPALRQAASSLARLDPDGIWFARCCIRCAKLICVVRTGSILPKDSFVTRFTNSTCSLSISAHLNCTAATSGNASGWNRAPGRVHKSVTKTELGDGSFQIVSQPHSPPIMCTSVSRTERKLPPRSRVNSSTLRVETACKTSCSPSGRIRRVAECHLWSR